MMLILTSALEWSFLLPVVSEQFMGAFQHIRESTVPEGSESLCGCNLHGVYVYAVL